MLKIISLELQNFIQYSGNQKIDFSFNEQKPLNVIFGENGEGKSGIIKAIRWVLFGRTNDKAFDGESNYINLLNREALKKNNYEIQVRLILKNGSDNFNITRIKKLKAGVNEFKSFRDVDDDDCQIFKNGEAIAKNNQNFILNSIMTEEMSIFNFIQGEEIFRYYDVDHMNVKKCIEAVLKLPELGRASNILKLIGSDLREKLTKSGFSNTQIQKLNEDKQKRDKLESNLKSLEESISKCDNIINDFSQKYNKQKEIYEKQDRLLKKISENIEKETDIKVNLKQSTPHIWKNIIKDEVDKFLKKYPPEINLKNKDLIYLLDESLKKNECLICNQDIQSIRNHLLEKKERNSDFDAEKKDYSLTLQDKFSDNKFDFNLYKQNLKELEGIKLSNIVDQEEIDVQKKQIGSLDDYNKAKQNSENALKIRTKNEIEKEKLIKEITDIKDHIKIREDIIKEDNTDLSNLEKQTQIVDDYQNCFEEIKLNLIKNTKQKIESEANVVFNKLLNSDKNYYLKINDQFKLEMYETNSQQSDHYFEPSTGQKVIIMYSLIYAFRKVANFEGVLFVDNIFPNLSDSVKTQTLNLIPQLFNHIVLVQLKESGDLNNKIISKSENVYFLNKDSALSSSIKKENI